MDNSAAGGQWQSDPNFTERTVNKKIESRLICGKGPIWLKKVSKDTFLLHLTDSCLFSSKVRHNIII